MVGTISFLWMSSSDAIDPSTSSRPKGYITLLHGKKDLGSCRICLILMGTGRADISLFRGRTGYAIQWATMPHDFDNTWGIVKDSGLVSSIFPFTFSTYSLSV